MIKRAKENMMENEIIFENLFIYIDYIFPLICFSVVDFYEFEQQNSQKQFSGSRFIEWSSRSMNYTFKLACYNFEFQ